MSYIERDKENKEELKLNIDLTPPPPPEKSLNLSKWTNGKAEFKEAEKNGKKYYFLFAEHGSEKAQELFTKKIIPKLNDPQSWAFFVEGGKSNINFLEIKLINSIADEAKISIFNPIIDPYNVKVIEKAINEEKIKRDTVILALTGKMLVTFKVEVGGELIYDEFLNRMTEYFNKEGVNINKNYLNELIISASANLIDAKDIISKTFDKLIKISNDLSKSLFNEKLKQIEAENKITNIFVYAGAAHSSVFDL
jgi:hypothetical protein